MSDPFGLTGLPVAGLSDDIDSGDESSGDDAEEVAQAAQERQSSSPAATAEPSAENADEASNDDGSKKRKSGLLSMEEASAKLDTSTELRTFKPPEKKQREEARSLFSYVPDDGHLDEAKIGTDNARTLEVPFRTAAYLLGNNSKQRKAIESATGSRIYVQSDPRDAKDKAPLKVTIVGDDTALIEAERRIVDANGHSARFVERVVHCKAHQCGAIIGKGGVNIKKIQGHSGVHMTISGNKGEAQTADAMRAVVLRGPPEAVEVAARLVYACMRSPAEMEALFTELRGFGDKAYDGEYGDAAAFAAQSWAAMPQVPGTSMGSGADLWEYHKAGRPPAAAAGLAAEPVAAASEGGAAGAAAGAGVE